MAQRGPACDALALETAVEEQAASAHKLAYSRRAHLQRHMLHTPQNLEQRKWVNAHRRRKIRKNGITSEG